MDPRLLSLHKGQICRGMRKRTSLCVCSLRGPRSSRVSCPLQSLCHTEGAIKEGHIANPNPEFPLPPLFSVCPVLSTCRPYHHCGWRRKGRGSDWGQALADSKFSLLGVEAGAFSTELTPLIPTPLPGVNCTYMCLGDTHPNNYSLGRVQLRRRSRNCTKAKAL